MSARFQTSQNAFTFDPLFVFEGTSTEGSANYSSSPALSEILPVDVQQHQLKVNCCLNSLGEAHFDLLNLHRCLYHPRRLEAK